MDRKSKSRTNRWTTPALILGILAITAYATRDDWAGVQDRRSMAAAAERDRQAAEAELVELTAKRAKMETPAGQEAQARKLGYVKPGETPLN